MVISLALLHAQYVPDIAGSNETKKRVGKMSAAAMNGIMHEWQDLYHMSGRVIRHTDAWKGESSITWKWLIEGVRG